MNEDLVGGIQDAARKYTCYAAPFIAGLAARGNPTLFALGVPAAILAAQPFCGTPNPPLPYVPPSIPFLGGQCATIYRYTANFVGVDDESVTTYFTNDFQGPVTVCTMVSYPGAFGDQWAFARQSAQDGGVLRYFPQGLLVRVWKLASESLILASGNSDNCGNQPIGVPQVPTPPSYPQVPDDPDGNPILPPFSPPPIPWTPPGGNKPIFLPIVFPPVVIPIAPRFPISVPISLGGVTVGDIKIGFDGSLTINVGSDVQSETDDIFKLLEEIKKCACKESPPSPPTIPVDVPYVSTEGSCQISVVPIRVVEETYPPSVASKLSGSAGLALLGCKAKTPEQKQEVLIGTGSTVNPAVEQFVSPIPPEVVSVRLSITGFNEGLVQAVSTFPAASQFKFGSIGYSLLPQGAAGDYTYVFDKETYYPLPRRGKPGVIRLLLRPSVEWSLYDTGERLS